MSSRFTQLLKHAVSTCHPKNASSFKSNFQDLKELLDSLTMSDINLPAHLYSKSSFVEPNKAPCTFVNIFENENVVRGSRSIVMEIRRMSIYNRWTPIHCLISVTVCVFETSSYKKMKQISRRSAFSF